MKPKKKTDIELFKLLAMKIESGDYLFLSHAKQRLKDRNITDLEVLEILENKKRSERKRNKSKDKYENNYQDWNYCIEGKNIDATKIRIIITFSDELLLIITAIRMNS